MLVGRDGELERVGRLLDDVRGGVARSLLVVGEAGIGKTALMQAAVEAAPDFTRLWARGVETEGEIGGAVLSELLGQSSRLRPELHGAWSSLPKRLRRAVQAAQRLHPLSGDRFSVVAAWTALVVAASETRPVLVVLDDGQWCDAVSLGAVLFAARRVHDVPVATLVAVREPPRAAAVFDGLDRLVLGRLDPVSATILAARHGVTAPGVVDAAGGNPLALVELARRGSGSATDDVAEVLFGPRVSGLTPQGRRSLLVAALAGPLETDVLAAASSRAGVTELTGLGLATTGSGVLELVHPLLGALIRGVAGVSEQRDCPRRAGIRTAAGSGADTSSCPGRDRTGSSPRSRGGTPRGGGATQFVGARHGRRPHAAGAWAGSPTGRGCAGGVRRSRHGRGTRLPCPGVDVAGG